jgi:hypothetical protein
MRQHIHNWYNKDNYMEVDMPEVIPELKIDKAREVELLKGMKELFIPVPQGQFPRGRSSDVKRLAYFYSLRTEISAKLFSMGITDVQERSDHPLMQLIAVLIDEYTV